MSSLHRPPDHFDSTGVRILMSIAEISTPGSEISIWKFGTSSGLKEKKTSRKNSRWLSTPTVQLDSIASPEPPHSSFRLDFRISARDNCHVIFQKQCILHESIEMNDGDVTFSMEISGNTRNILDPKVQFFKISKVMWLSVVLMGSDVNIVFYMFTCR